MGAAAVNEEDGCGCGGGAEEEEAAAGGGGPREASGAPKTTDGWDCGVLWRHGAEGCMP